MKDQQKVRISVEQVFWLTGVRKYVIAQKEVLGLRNLKIDTVEEQPEKYREGTVREKIIVDFSSSLILRLFF